MKKLKIGLIGKMRSGKDTIGEWLINEYDFKKYAFADGIGEIIDKYFPTAREQGKPRKHYQYIGQSMRKLDADVWVNYLLKTVQKEDYHRIVITDVRQENEVKALKENGFTIIKIEAVEGVRLSRKLNSGDVFNLEDLSHETEQFSEVVEADITIVNNGTIEELQREVLNIINKLLDEQ